MNSFFKRLFLADFWKGMILTFRTQNPKYIYTEQYPLDAPWWPSGTAVRRA